MAEDRDLPASERRLQRARDQGDVPLSRELPLLAGVLAGSAALAATLPGTAHTLRALLLHALERPDAPLPAAATAGWTALRLVLPAGLAAWVAIAATGLLQTGFLLRPAALTPNLGRLSPASGLSRLFGTDGLIAAAKALAKFAILAACLAVLLRPELRRAAAALAAPPATLLAALGQAAWHTALVLLGVQAAATAADLFLVRFRHAARLRMSRQEQKDEHKESEGNPEAKQKLRALARRRARRRMMAAIPKATVVLTNPTHYAVALAYQRGSHGAPRVVAKGADEVAARIREVARDNNIPIVENPPLARALFAVELESEIPAEHFRAVAEIIAYVWRLRPMPARR
jgi:flagellar biosynthesis protein FlhB